jgi:hypothetical protein
MIAELAHFLRYAPATLALQRRLPQDQLYATLIARADAAGLANQRAVLVAGLRGHVVEIGCGTVAMFPWYSGDLRMRRRSSKRRTTAERGQCPRNHARDA